MDLALSRYQLMAIRGEAIPHPENPTKESFYVEVLKIGNSGRLYDDNICIETLSGCYIAR